MRLLAATIGTLVVTGGVFSLAGVSAKAGWSDTHTERMRGTDAYYETSESRGRVSPVNVRLAGSPEVFLQLGFVFAFRKGKELEAAAPLVEQRMPYLVDALLVKLTRWSADDLRTRQGKLRLKRWLRELAQAELFVDGQARVTKVYLDPFFLQVTGA